MGATHSNSTTTIVTAKHKNAVMSPTKFKFQPQNGQIKQQIYPQEPPKLKGILKNKDAVKNEKIQRPVKIVELYVQRGDQWTVTRVSEIEAEMKKRELKSDKNVKRIYVKPTHDTTFLHFKAF
ncbi:hypothetical protein PVAND_017034 [Polypedilum vanderplanki]|uniref:Uncharacterized protein n=1 Tax=Polypedilum vanderplanki TaxID=319348 RepID=A0A9J6BHY1_POLVA|nr:hypothetical protein PVAND_017034 [Polypedilum vanderplanki]